MRLGNFFLQLQLSIQYTHLTDSYFLLLLCISQITLRPLVFSPRPISNLHNQRQLLQPQPPPPGHRRSFSQRPFLRWNDPNLQTRRPTPPPRLLV
jgi:hypothetical protein